MTARQVTKQQFILTPSSEYYYRNDGRKMSVRQPVTCGDSGDRVTTGCNETKRIRLTTQHTRDRDRKDIWILAMSMSHVDYFSSHRSEK